MKKYIIPITDLRKTNDILNLVKENEVVHITKNGYSDLVVMSQEYYDSITCDEVFNSFKEENKFLKYTYIGTITNAVIWIFILGMYLAYV